MLDVLVGALSEVAESSVAVDAVSEAGVTVRVAAAAEEVGEITGEEDEGVGA